jgi:hypothetical protein
VTDQHPGQAPKQYCDPHDVSQLEEPLRSRVAQAIHDAPMHGIVPVSLRRTPDMQYDLRAERVGVANVFRFPPKGDPVTAVPAVRNPDGSWGPGSNHQKGRAADLGGRDMGWLHAHTGGHGDRDGRNDYGLFLAVPSESWHFEASTSEPLKPIAPFGKLPNRNEGRKWVAVVGGSTDEKVYAQGGFDNEVSEVQIRLKKRGFYKGAVDGDYGPQSEHATTLFKIWTIKIQRAWHEPAWPNTDPIVGQATIKWLRQVTA